MNHQPTTTIRVIDSHTEGEPTRVIITGGPDLGSGTVAQRLNIFRERFDHVRSAVVNEPRGSDPVVGALLCTPSDPSASIGVIFFNNVGFLGMCGHGTIGVVATLAHLGRIAPGAHTIETSVGNITATLHEDGSVSVANVASYRTRKGVALTVSGLGTGDRTIHGDVAWGGNWFFLCDDHGVPTQPPTPENLERLTAAAGAIRRELSRQGIRGTGGEEIDHVELFGKPGIPANHSRNFVLCPGGAYDRSPCGTGTSAKLACLAGDGKLMPGEEFRQESIIGSVFAARYALEAGAPIGENPRVLPVITGRAFVTADATLILDPRDPFVHGIRL